MRDCYTVSSIKIHKGITLQDGKVRLGETGRGREMVEIPPPTGSMIQNDELLQVPGEGGAILYIPDLSGYRGSWELGLKNPDWFRVYDARIEHRRLIETHPESDDNREFLIPAGHDTVWECKKCKAPDLIPIPNSVKVIATGRRAQGLAGRMGGGPEYLIHVPFGTTLEIRRLGRTYSAPRVLWVEVNESGVNLIDAEKHVTESTVTW